MAAAFTVLGKQMVAVIEKVHAIVPDASLRRYIHRQLYVAQKIRVHRRGAGSRLVEEVSGEAEFFEL